MGQPYQLVYSVKNNLFRPTVYPSLPLVQFSLLFFFLHATADDMPAKTEKVKVLNHLEVCFQPMKTTNGPVANVIGGNVQLYVLSHKEDNFQGYAIMVLDRLCRLCCRYI